MKAMGTQIPFIPVLPSFFGDALAMKADISNMQINTDICVFSRGLPSFLRTGCGRDGGVSHPSFFPLWFRQSFCLEVFNWPPTRSNVCCLRD